MVRGNRFPVDFVLGVLARSPHVVPTWQSRERVRSPSTNAISALGTTSSRLVLQLVQAPRGEASDPSGDGTDAGAEFGGKGIASLTLLMTEHNELAGGELFVAGESSKGCAGGI